MSLLDRLIPRDDKITCFSYGGLAYANNTKCSDSDSCCQTTAQCRPDRLCNSNTNTNVILRPTCANDPYSLQTCAQICLYDNASGVLPRVNICPDGSYCCDNDTSCCADKTGVFLDQNGVVTGRANATSTASSAATSSASTASSATSTSANAKLASSTSSSTAAASQGLSGGAKAGIGIGVTLGAIALVGVALAFFFIRRRRLQHNTHQAGAQSMSNPIPELYTPPTTMRPDNGPSYTAVPGLHEAPPNSRPAELGAESEYWKPAYENNASTLHHKPSEIYT